MLAGAKALFTREQDELCVIAAILGVPTYLVDRRSGLIELQREDAASLLVRALGNGPLADPFTGEQMSLREAIELCGFWRALIDSNRDIAGAVGFAFWKRDNVAPLLWGGSGPVRFEDVGPDGRPVAIWRSKAPPEAVELLQHSAAPLIEVEDGFLRSQGLGADCVPPLSITIDRLGAYFDPSGPSELERLLQDGEFDEVLLARARALRSVIVGAGLGKYEAGGAQVDRRAGDRRHVLVPGQVEDDRSVLAGGCGLVSNLELLKRVREQAPEAYILFKPHPDVLAGHRKGSISERACLELADEIVIDLPISSLIGMVDEVHVNTSLAGFEALIRDKAVTTYGVPFYAGWGLTCDLGPVPSRRTAKRTPDELVAAALLLYPRYLDPVSGLPCPAEVVVRRLADGAAGQAGLVVAARRFQGKVMRRLRELAP
jgi:capsular polysaccharide export protein